MKELYEKAQLNIKDMSISAGFAKFLFYVKTQYSPGNYRHIQSHLRTLTKDLDLLDITMFSQVTNDLLFELCNILVERGCSAPTINRRLQLLIRIHKFLAEEDLLTPYNFKYRKLKELEPHVEMVSEEDLLRILEHIEKYLCTRSQLVVMMLLTTGVRRSELTRIKMRHVDLENKQIFLDDTKTKKARYLFLTDEVIELIKGCSLDNVTYLLEDDNHQQMTPNAISMIIKRIGLALDIPKLSPHKFRHSYATILLKNGCDVESLRRLMGHSSLKMTIRYLNYTNDELKQANLKFNPLYHLEK